MWDAIQKHNSAYVDSSTKLQLDIILFFTANECLQRDEYAECKLQLIVTCQNAGPRITEQNRTERPF